MEKEQKKFSNKTKFEFGDEELKHTIKDKRNTVDFKIKYAEFPVSCNTFEERNEWLRNAGLIWVALGIFILGTAIMNGDPLSGKGFWIMVGAICLVSYKFSSTKYSVFPTDNGNVFIIRDKQHDEIVDEINGRKRTQLLDWHGEINRENDPEYEIGKFNWLKEQGVLSEDEANTKIEQVKWGSK